ncbi:MAG TPA: glycoside hydrolase family 15 protein [Bryobacteraceae bacterium]|nr:glycoside hydrolase family 15 protein [Bryobacteraceae bacterium]
MNRTYEPIEDYGVIGNMRTVALVSRTGSLDWFCYPNFDSPSVFGALLDAEKGGHFCIAPQVRELTHKQLYWPDTNILITRFMAAEGVAEIIDYMPVVPHEGHGYDGIIRQLKMIRGEMTFRVECKPAFNYARDSYELEFQKGGVNFHSKKLTLRLASQVEWKRRGDTLISEFHLKTGASQTFEVYGPAQGEQPGMAAPQSDELFRATVKYWRRWLHRSRYHGRWRETVNRSALLLKLLTFEPTGAIVAAPTCSLPEVIGGARNWDYRYTWIRDSSFTIYALLRIGFTEEASRFMAFLDARCHEMKRDGTLQVMYGIDGRHLLTEETLTHLDGYKGSAPVRVGNAAYKQVQLDIYGELMDSVYLFNKHGSPISYDLWTYLRRLTDWVARNWEQEDDAIWEVRGGRRKFVFSKMMCWVALDRALRLADQRGFPADWKLWMRTRDSVYEAIMERGWSRRRQAFVQSFGSDSLDASLLLMPLVFFVAPTDPRMLATLDAVMKPPVEHGLVSDGLVFRYDRKESPDGLKGHEGTFNLCTFWLVEALTRAGKLEEARLLFEHMLAYANHLGLYAEQIGLQGQALGNFPQALTHLSLISAAFNLDRRLDGA